MTRRFVAAFALTALLVLAAAPSAEAQSSNQIKVRDGDAYAYQPDAGGFMRWELTWIARNTDFDLQIWVISGPGEDPFDPFLVCWGRSFEPYAETCHHGIGNLTFLAVFTKFAGKNTKGVFVVAETAQNGTLARGASPTLKYFGNLNDDDNPLLNRLREASASLPGKR